MRWRSDIVVAVALSLAACGKGTLKADAGATLDSSGAAGAIGGGAGSGATGGDAGAGAVGGAASTGRGGSGGNAGSGGGAGAGGGAGGRGGAGGSAGAGGGAGGSGKGGGAGAGARGGAGGTARGGAGGGDGAGGIRGFEARAVATDCSAATNTVAGAVVVDATITCTLGAGEFSVAAGAGDRGFVSLSSFNEGPPGRFITVEANGSIAAIKGPAGAYSATVLTDADGAAYVHGNRLPGPGLGFFRLDGQGWWGEAVNPALDATTMGATMRGRFGADGRAHLAYNLADGMLALSIRTAANSWTQVLAPTTSYTFAVTVDSQQRPHVLFLLASGAYDWIPGSLSPMLLAPLVDTRTPFAAAPFSADRVAASSATVNAIAVVVPLGSGPATIRTVPGTPQLAIRGCPPLPISGSMAPTPCTNTGDGVLGHALAATGGALWVAYVSRHEDSDHTQACFPFENSSICMEQLVSDRSTNEVVLVRVPPDPATGPPTVVWRAPITGNPMPAGAAVAMDASAARLVIAVQSPATLTTRPNVVRYLMFDPGKL